MVRVAAIGVGSGHSGVGNVGARASSPAAFRRGLADVRTLLAGRVPVWWIAALDVDARREVAQEKLGNILGFVAAYILGPAPEARGVPPALVPAVRELRKTYTTRRSAMDPELTKRLGLFDYLRQRLAIAGTPDDCVAPAKAALAAGARKLMFTVSLAADPERTVELFGREVLPALRS